MGLFSFIGKAVGAIGKVVGGVAKVAAPFLPGPLGGVAKVVGSVLQVKHGASPKVITGGNPYIMRGRSAPQAQMDRYRTPNGIRAPVGVLRASPVMPGGGVATPQGIMASGGGVPPTTYAGQPGALWRQAGGMASTLSRRGSKSKTKSSRPRKSRAPSKKRTAKRRLKFGSPAWRKKYMKKSRKRAA